MNLTPIKTLELLGIPKDELSLYSVRLNSSLGDWDITTAYYNDHRSLLDHAHTVYWEKPEPGKQENYPIHTPRVLQFINLSQTGREYWLFVGAFNILEGTHGTDAARIANYEEIEHYASYAGRLVVHYKRRQGPSHFTLRMTEDSNDRNHVLENMFVHKISEAPISAQAFPGFESVRLTHRELAATIKNTEWQAALSSVSAIYLLTDRRTGWKYVGSAYSRKGSTAGLLSRWADYTRGNFSGGSKLLSELTPDYIQEHFQFSILEIFDRRTTLNEIIQREHWWMDTLCTVRRESSPFGYNSVREHESELGTQE